jgi:hypothetical protein
MPVRLKQRNYLKFTSITRRACMSVFCRLFLVLIWLAVVLFFPFLTSASGSTTKRSMVHLEPLGVVSFDTGLLYNNTEVGGISAIAYDEKRRVYYLLSDDRSEKSPARFYSATIDLADGSLERDDVTFTDVTFLHDQHGLTFPPGSVDPEGIALVPPELLIISTEGSADADRPIDPFVRVFNLLGRQLFELEVPDTFLPDGKETSGVRNNKGFESLSATPGRNHLYTASENALYQDGPETSLKTDSPSRILEYDLRSKEPAQEFVYMASPIPKSSIPPGLYADSGLVELLALDNSGTFLALERSYAAGVGNTVRLYQISTTGATDVSAFNSLKGHPFTPVSKKLIADFEQDLGIKPDNLEAMTFGPKLPDGRDLLIVVSDNNFNVNQQTQIIALALQLKQSSN